MTSLNGTRFMTSIPLSQHNDNSAIPSLIAGQNGISNINNNNIQSLSNRNQISNGAIIIDDVAPQNMSYNNGIVSSAPRSPSISPTRTSPVIDELQNIPLYEQIGTNTSLPTITSQCMSPIMQSGSTSNSPVIHNAAELSSPVQSPATHSNSLTTSPTSLTTLSPVESSNNYIILNDKEASY